MADFIVLAIHVCCVTLLRVAGLCLCRYQRKVDWTTCRHRTCNHELDEVPAIRTHAASPSKAETISALISALPSPRMRKRYQKTIATSENAKMMVDTALISGVMPRRSR